MDLKNDFLINELQRIGKLGVFIYDIKKDIWNSSELLDKLAGISDSYIKNTKGWLNTVHPSQRADMESYANEVIKTGKDFDIEYRLACENDEIEKWVAAKGKVFFNDQGVPEKLAGTIQDVSELKKSEERYKKLYNEELQKSIEEERRRLNELKEADRIKTEFFTNISHELRTPINVIFSALQMEELMLKDYLNDNIPIDKFKYIKMMKQNCYRLLRLINNLIDITKIDNGYFSLNESNDDIINLIENVTLSVAGYIENKGISITFDTDVEEKIIAHDPEKIERVILNLLSNAVKFTPCNGNIIVKVEDNTNDICIRVKDTGKGIPDNKLDSIFERFVQVDKSLTRNHEGSGIGLSIVKSLVELHSGKIIVKSKEGIGTEFVINIPCKLIEGESYAESTCNAQIGKSYIEKINMEFSDIYN
ncbi:PAS domain-containing sensor histidine kinase [Clostridium magnum]|uniref:histidine kinase n=1 Tax=Clostridium magnum DSM 2767 TaxID=1121326 RepID=A0A162RXV7_9CLOT|nr:PAS domain-containing sensor histidine kinase [Clostridium magnum]KZL90524.1 sensor histidine kinase TodS [Clostridium magnum DSM 2767]SHI04496.1 Signal transduction histidine kinase [Clostridium magnum DSM 2767]